MTDKELIKLAYQQVEAMQQALEALEAYRPVIVKRHGLTYSVGDSAITALQEALNASLAEQPSGVATIAQQEPVEVKQIEELSSENIRLQNLVKDLSDWNDKLRERLSYREAYPDNFLKEPEQEPVATVSGYYGGQCVILPMQPDRIFNSGTTFYTSPPAQRAWEGLTDEEWQDLSDRYGLIIWGKFKQEIEAKLKEKNT